MQLQVSQNILVGVEVPDTPAPNVVASDYVQRAFLLPNPPLILYLSFPASSCLPAFLTNVFYLPYLALRSPAGTSSFLLLVPSHPTRPALPPLRFRA